MREYLIRCVDDDWSLPYAQWDEAFRPNSLPSCRLPGEQHRIEVAGVPIYFADEAPGIQMCVEGQLEEATARRIADEVLKNVERLTGQRGEVIEL